MMMRYSLFGAFFMVFAIPCLGQSSSHFSVEEVRGEKRFFLDIAYPKYAALVFSTSLGTPLTFRSNSSQGIINTSLEDNGDYRLVVDTTSQTIRVSAPGFEDVVIEIEKPTRNDIRYFQIEREITLSIRANVDGAQVSIDGEVVGETPLESYQFRTGSFELSVSKSDFHRHTENVRLDSTRIIDVVLNPLSTAQPGRLVVGSYPEGATVLVDGENKGLTPFESTMLAGTYALQVEHEGYVTDSRQISILPGQAENILIRLVSEAQAIEIRSTPEGADVYINRELVGQTPWSGRLRPEPYLLHLRRPGYKTHIEEFTVANRALSLPPIDLELGIRPESGDDDRAQNIELVPEGDDLTIHYDLVGKGQHKFNVRLLLIPQEVNASEIELNEVSGFIGRGVQANDRKRIIWRMSYELAPLAQDVEYVLRVDARRQLAWHWLGAGVGGGIAGALLIGRGKDQSLPDGPPGRPNE